MGKRFWSRRRGWVVAISSRRTTTLSASSLSALGIPVRIETQNPDSAAIEDLEAALEDLHGRVRGDYGFGYEPAVRKMVVQSEAPVAEFAALEKAYPGLISYRPGTWAHTADWSNDSQRHWGGAWLQGGGWACTSGYAMEDNNGYRYMLTAGHCFTNGTSTNMGTAVRPSQGDPWSYWDAELLKGHSYAGYVYVSRTGGNKVKNAANPGVGYQYCTTGRSSGFKCAWTVQVVNKTICFNDQPSCFHDLAGFTRSDGQIVRTAIREARSTLSTATTPLA